MIKLAIRYIRKISIFHFSNVSLDMKPDYLQSRDTYHQKNTFPINKSDSLEEIFDQRNMNKIKKVLDASSFLNELDSVSLGEMCQKFLKYSVSQESHRSILLDIEGIVNKFELKKPASEYFQKLEVILQFLDSAEAGFLKGDIHPHSVFKIQHILKQKIQNLKSKRIQGLSMSSLYKEILESITKTSEFRLPLNGIKDLETQNPRNLYERQLILENESNQMSLDKFYKAYESLQRIDKTQNLDISRKYIIDWFPQLAKAIKDQQNLCRNIPALKGDRKMYSEFFLKVTPQKLATIALTQLMKQILSQISRRRDDNSQDIFYGYIISKVLFQKIGHMVNCQIIYDVEELKFKQKQKQLEKQRNKKINKIALQTNKSVEEVEQQQNHAASVAEQSSEQNGMKYMKPEARRKYLQKLASRILKPMRYDRQFHTLAISKQIQIQIGSVLTYLLKQIVKIKNIYDFYVPLLTPQYKKQNKHSPDIINVLRINQHFISTLIPLLEKHDSPFMHLERSLPTICQPSPWVDYEIGGYYLRPTSIMRFSESEQQQRAIKFSDLKRVGNLLNILGNIPWKINNKVLAVVQAIWQDGGGKGCIPHRYYNMKDYIYPFQLKEEKDYKKQLEMLKKIQMQRDEHSMRCDFGLKLNVAQTFSKVEKFFFPHNLDFRGRVYPIPPHLNHIGADLARGLLLFSDGKKLGKSGLRWLKIHCANLMGKDKATLNQKVQFVDNHIPFIQALANDPLNNTQWLSYQDSWQAISTIMQLNDALNSDNPEQFVSHLHIHQDGSCNGLQHYAALGRDSEGASQVNLDVLDRPGDVYTYVAKMVAKIVEKDASDAESPNFEIANKVKGNIKRKTVKQTVMTSVYGVTFIGAREQIHRQIKDQHFMEQQEEYIASIYIAKATMESIKNLFQGAHNIKRWFIECAGLIVKTNNPVSWMTPMGLPVVQPYRKKSSIDVVNTLTQDIVLYRSNDSLPINVNKQRSAFPPNFIHSLDSTHMMYTAQHSHKKGLTFAAVHDSYWTHAGSIEQMNKILRQQFVRLHSEPLLENLKESFEKRFPEIQFPDIPQRGEFDLNKVKESLYFFS